MKLAEAARGGTLTMPAEEDQLVKEARAGSKRAYMELLDRHDKLFRSVAFAVAHDRTLMDDVLQEAFLKGYRSIGRLRERTSFRNWMCRIVHNTAIDELRRARSIPAEIADSIDPSHTTAETIEAVSMVTQALAQLPVEQRVVMRLIDGEQYGYEEVASLLDVPLGTVASRARAGRRTLRSLLHEYREG